MTLKKTQPKRPTRTSHRKRTAQHHRKGQRYAQAYWPYLPIVAIMLFGMIFNSWYSTRQGVLGYAVDMSISGLLQGTNNERVAQGLGSLALNASLNQAAQNKAQDMAARDYWSHNTPDGQAPWTFIVATGYSYQTAGENLAYGFATSTETITGWMNSPGHRANILNGTYQEVGFGIANTPNYQSSGPQTVVVAMYAQPVPTAPAPPPAPVASPVVSPTPTQAPTPAPSATKPTSTVPATAPAEPTAEAPQTEPVASQSSGGGANSALPVNATAQGDAPEKASAADRQATQKVSRVQVLTAANLAWSQFALSMLASVALLAFLLRHSFAWHKVLVKGERFILHHPLLDILFVTVATLGFILLQTSGFIR